MSRLELPLIERKLQSTGDLLLRAELALEIKSNQGEWKSLTFLVDPGTEMTTMRASEARDRDLPIPRKPVPGLTFKGEEVRAGLLRARVTGMDPTEYVIPCYFVGDMNVAPPAQAKNLLGLTGVINQLRLSFDGRPYPGAQGGILVVETY
jgi:hypothetical protein